MPCAINIQTGQHAAKDVMMLDLQATCVTVSHGGPDPHCWDQGDRRLVSGCWAGRLPIIGHSSGTRASFSAHQCKLTLSRICRGFETKPILPLTCGSPSALGPQDRDWDILLTAETHNFPCAVAPYPGACLLPSLHVDYRQF